MYRKFIDLAEKFVQAFPLRCYGGFPGGAVVENLPASAGDTGSSPGLGRSYMPQSNWAREPPLLSLCVWSLCSATREAAIVRGPRTAMKSGPHSLQLEKALAQKRRPNTARNNKLININFKKCPYKYVIIFDGFSLFPIVTISAWKIQIYLHKSLLSFGPM